MNNHNSAGDELAPRPNEHGGLHGLYWRAVAKLTRPATRPVIKASEQAARAASQQLESSARQLSQQLERSTERLGSQLDGSVRGLYRQLEALTALYAVLDVRQPFPPMRDWAASPDFACELVRVIHEDKPATILELGSGVSTLVAAYALERNQRGRIITLDHDGSWAKDTTRRIAQHGLEGFATVIHAPLVDLQIDGEPWLWYDLSAVEELHDVDMVIVDGPPGTMGPLARYPALPLLRGSLSAGALIVLDDADRPDELQILDRWNQQYGPLSVERPRTEKGMAALRIAI